MLRRLSPVLSLCFAHFMTLLVVTMPTTYKMEFKVTQPTIASVRTRTRSNFASQHLDAAIYFQTVVASQENDGPASKKIFAPPQHRHCWYATVTFAVMAIEANVYDIMTAIDRGDPTPLTEKVSAEAHKEPTLNRYGLVHSAITGKHLEIGQGIGQEVRALILLRDEVTHYKTEFRDDAAVSKKLWSLLRNRFTLNPFRCGDIFFPEECVSANSGAWAVDTAREFMQSFAKATGIKPNV